MMTMSDTYEFSYSKGYSYLVCGYQSSESGETIGSYILTDRLRFR